MALDVFTCAALIMGRTGPGYWSGRGTEGEEEKGGQNLNRGSLPQVPEKWGPLHPRVQESKGFSSRITEHAFASLAAGGRRERPCPRRPASFSVINKIQPVIYEKLKGH